MQYLTGQGFIGSHLASKLGKYTHIPHDDIHTIDLQPYDRFFFCSSYGNLITQTDLNLTITANILDLISILGKTDLEKGFKSFVFMSTSSVRLKRQTTYSRTKRAAEEILLAVMERYDLPICIVRPFSVTGVGEQKEHLIPTLIRSCMTGEQMNFTPRPVHDYIDVEDVVGGILNLSSHSARGIYELGSGIQYSNQEVLELVQDATGKKANINIVDNMRPYDTDQWVSGNFKSRGYGWVPRIPLVTSIKNMVEAYKNEN